MPWPRLAPVPPSERGGLLWYHLWTAVLAANLVFPITVASGMIREGGRVGVAAAIGLLWMIGAWLGARSREMRSALIAGGLGVAVLQLVPIIQIFAGMFGLALSVPFHRRPNTGGFDEDFSGFTEFGGFVATFATGAALILSAWGLGLAMIGLRRGFAAGRPGVDRPADDPTGPPSL